MISQETYHPHLILSDHFDRIINQIDIYTEVYIKENFFKYSNQDQDNEELNRLNKMRDKKIEQLTQMQQKHLFYWERLQPNEFEVEWHDLINDSTLNYEQKLSQIKEKLIFSDAILIEVNSNNDFKMTGNALKMNLWIMPFYLNETNSQFIK